MLRRAYVIYLKCSVSEKIPIVFYNGSNCDFDFIIKNLAEEFNKQFTCLGEYTKKYIPFRVPRIYKKLQTLIKMEKKLKYIYMLRIAIY